jgi:hypothetical protein
MLGTCFFLLFSIIWGHSVAAKIWSRSPILLFPQENRTFRTSSINLCHLGAELSILRCRKRLQGVNYPWNLLLIWGHFLVLIWGHPVFRTPYNGVKHMTILKNTQISERNLPLLTPNTNTQNWFNRTSRSLRNRWKPISTCSRWWLWRPYWNSKTCWFSKGTFPYSLPTHTLEIDSMVQVVLHEIDGNQFQARWWPYWKLKHADFWKEPSPTMPYSPPTRTKNSFEPTSHSPWNLRKPITGWMDRLTIRQMDRRQYP